jgi:hypothetical protein
MVRVDTIIYASIVGKAKTVAILSNLVVANIFSFHNEQKFPKYYFDMLLTWWRKEPNFTHLVEELEVLQIGRWKCPDNLGRTNLEI